MLEESQLPIDDMLPPPDTCAGDEMLAALEKATTTVLQSRAGFAVNPADEFARESPDALTAAATKEVTDAVDTDAASPVIKKKRARKPKTPVATPPLVISTYRNDAGETVTGFNMTTNPTKFGDTENITLKITLDKGSTEVMFRTIRVGEGHWTLHTTVAMTDTSIELKPKSGTSLSLRAKSFLQRFYPTESSSYDMLAVGTKCRSTYPRWSNMEFATVTDVYTQFDSAGTGTDVVDVRVKYKRPADEDTCSDSDDICLTQKRVKRPRMKKTHGEADSHDDAPTTEVEIV